MGADSVSLQHCLMRFGMVRGELRLIVVDFVEWFRNGRLPWAAYRAMMSSLLIVLDKHPGVRLFGVGETWWRLVANCLLQVVRQESKAACRT